MAIQIGPAKKSVPAPKGESAGARLVHASEQALEIARTTKVPIHIRLDVEVVNHYRKSGPGWQTRLNADLRALHKL